ncbi:MAG: hypothetical protein EOP06_15990 [Proteobacteria bacterium]|nr:MAG: hypothetical protein EOP06_15990 [Pseudomonadota bacterium]
MRLEQIPQTSEDSATPLVRTFLSAPTAPTATVTLQPTSTVGKMSNRTIPLAQTVGMIGTVTVIETLATVFIAVLSKAFYEGRFFELDSRHVIAFFLFSLLLSALNAVGISYAVEMLANRRFIAPSLVTANIVSVVCWHAWIAPALYVRTPRLDSPVTWLVGLFSLVTGTTIQILTANYVSRKQGKG